jgi:relaxase-like protein
VIAKAPENGKRGADTYGLLGYLFGPGRANEHSDPHLVAAWDPAWLAGGAFAQPHRGWLARLGREIDASMTGHSVSVAGGHVYHVVLSIPRQDGALGDPVWRELVDEAIERMGFGPDVDGRGGCRWVAVHHGPSKEGNDHIHLVLNLVRGDGRVADTYRDWPRWRQWCLDVERRLGLTATSPSNKTAPLRPTRAETEKATRMRRGQTSREYLRGLVRAAAIRASTAEEFVALVNAESLVSIEPRWTAEGRLGGYRVALSADYSRSSPDRRVWFGGSQLARDLSAPKLEHRWASTSTLPAGDDDSHGTSSQAERKSALEDATGAVDRARAVLVSVGSGTLGNDVNGADLADEDVGDGIAHTTLDLMFAAAKIVEGYDQGPLTDAARVYERAAATPYRVQPSRWAPVAAELRTAARRLARIGVLTRRETSGIATVALIVALAGLLAEIAAWREQTQQPRQADASRQAATLLAASGYPGRRPTAPYSRPEQSARQSPPAAEQRPSQRDTTSRLSRPGTSLRPLDPPRRGRAR